MPAIWNMVGKPILTAENSATIPGVSQRFRLPATKPNSLFQGAVCAAIFHDSIFDALSLELWSDRDGAPSKLIATSTNSWSKAQVDAQFTLDYKCVWLGFEFVPIPVRRLVWYHLALRATTYTGDATNHIAWRHSYPDAQYRDGLGFTIEAINAGAVPLEALIMASEF